MSNSNTTPVQNETPAIRALRGFSPMLLTTSRIPTANSVAMTMAMDADTTAAGMARMTASALGRKARTRKTNPAATPMPRAAAPVTSTAATAGAWGVLGMVPARPASRFPVPSAATARCTARKSIARDRRHATRWAATATATDLVEPTRATKRNAGSSVQNGGPKPRSSPGGRTDGMPIQAASATRPMS